MSDESSVAPLEREPGSPAMRHVALSKAWLIALKVAFSFGLLVFLFTRMPMGMVAATLRSANPTLLISAFLLLFASNVLGTWQWQRLLEAVEIRIPFRRVLAYYHVGLFFNNFLPANVGGDIARVMDASRHGETRAAAVSTVVLDRVIGTVALAGLAVVTSVPAIDRFHLGLLYLALVAFLLISVGMLYGVLHPKVLPAIERVMSRVGLKLLEPHLDELSRRFAAYRTRGRLFTGLIAMALVIQVMRVGVHVLVARALGVGLPMTYFLLFVPLLAVIVSLPISLNGIGVREGAGMLLFGLVGVNRSLAFSLQFTTYLVAVAVSLLGALVLLGRVARQVLRSRVA